MLLKRAPHTEAAISAEKEFLLQKRSEGSEGTRRTVAVYVAIKEIGSKMTSRDKGGAGEDRAAQQWEQELADAVGDALKRISSLMTTFVMNEGLHKV